MLTEVGLQKNHQASTERDTDTDTEREREHYQGLRIAKLKAVVYVGNQNLR
jgi:hypothetical protein